MQETIEEEWKPETREKEGKRERVKRKLRKKVKIILLIIIS